MIFIGFITSSIITSTYRIDVRFVTNVLCFKQEGVRQGSSAALNRDSDKDHGDRMSSKVDLLRD